jgi:clan AA aspartic protease
MGLTFITGNVKGSRGKEISVNFLIDSGATYTLLPQKVWKALHLKAKRKVTFSLADGTPVERDISECYIRLPQGEGHSPVILGQDNDTALLGVVTLEILGLVLNPFNRTLQPMKMLLA